MSDVGPAELKRGRSPARRVETKKQLQACGFVDCRDDECSVNPKGTSACTHYCYVLRGQMMAYSESLAPN